MKLVQMISILLNGNGYPNSLTRTIARTKSIRSSDLRGWELIGTNWWGKDDSRWERLYTRMVWRVFRNEGKGKQKQQLKGGHGIRRRLTADQFSHTVDIWHIDTMYERQCCPEKNFKMR